MTKAGHVDATVKVTEQTARAVDIKNALIGRRRLNLSKTLPGKIEPDVGKEVDISSRVAGRVDSVLVSPSDFVKRGQLLAVLTSREVSDLEAQAIGLSAKLETARAQAEREKVVYDEQVHIPKALLDAKAASREAFTAMRLAKSKLNRQKILYKEKIGAEKDLIAAQAVYEQSESDLQQAQSNAKREEAFFKNKALLKAPLMKAEAELKQTEKELQALTSQLRFLGVDNNELKSDLKDGSLTGRIKLTAPISGQLSFFDISPGELIPVDKSIFRITDLSTVLVSADVPESDIPLARKGMTIHVAVPGIRKPVAATISILANHVDPATRTLPVRARVENSRQEFRPGMFADVTLVEENKLVLAVPKSAVQEVNGHKVVFVKTAQGFSERNVDLDTEGDDYIEVTSGLKEGDRVATQGSLMLKTQLTYAKKENND